MADLDYIKGITLYQADSFQDYQSSKYSDEIDLINVFERAPRALIIGELGAGKTKILNILQDLANENNKETRFFDLEQLSTKKFRGSIINFLELNVETFAKRIILLIDEIDVLSNNQFNELLSFLIPNTDISFYLTVSPRYLENKNAQLTFESCKFLSIPRISEKVKNEYFGEDFKKGTPGGKVENKEVRIDLSEIKQVIASNNSEEFWWLQANPAQWSVDEFNIGDYQEYSTHGENNNPRRIFENFFLAKTRELIIIYESTPTRAIKAIARVTKEAQNRKGDMLGFEMLYFFTNATSWQELLNLESFRNTSLAQNNQGSLFRISRDVFFDILNTTELFPLDTPIEVEPKQRDKIPFHRDEVVNIDQLGREPVAKAFVDLIKNDIFDEGMNHAFMVHLQGEWGSGKSSFLKFVDSNLNVDTEKWIVVEYNAWQNQHIKPPWWTMIDHIYRKAKKDLNWWCSAGLWVKENFRRIIWYRGWLKIITLVFAIFLIYLMFTFWDELFKFFTGESYASLEQVDKEKIDAQSDFAKYLLTITSGIGVLYTFSRFILTSFFIRSPEDAESFMSRASDPMNKIKKHFSKLIDNINSKRKKRQLAIFIDDIDRCNKEFIVKLLEGIQTLFKEKRVLYIVAGDKNWITKSFGNTYKEFASENQNQDQLGELFLEKAFQLSFRLPDIKQKEKEKYWKHILKVKEVEQKEKVTFEDLSEEVQKELNNTIINSKEEIARSDFMENIENKYNLTSNSVSNIIIAEKNRKADELKHLLIDFHADIDPNPRSIIRLANNYTMTRSILIAERRDIPADKIFRWLVIEDLCPQIKNNIHQITNVTEILVFLMKQLKNRN